MRNGDWGDKLFGVETIEAAKSGKQAGTAVPAAYKESRDLAFRG